ncbi:MAG: hypothetical protein M5T61_02340 [Acidimicrobiia bacterium]|nr:hypothetical protein [Acidimicrobiia bacterium]
MIGSRLRAALALSPVERRVAVERFFTVHPGGGAGPLGLGRAVADFVEWEISSGRIGDDGDGSAWWRVVNGGMTLDLIDALDALGELDGPGTPGAPGALGATEALDHRDAAGALEPDGGGSVSPWIVYARETAGMPGALGDDGRDGARPEDTARAQSLMWRAHQASLHSALDAADAAALLADERPSEREFARLVVDVVDATAHQGQATDTDALARTTDRYYPQEYPITPDQWRALHARFAPLLSSGQARNSDGPHLLECGP